jgi:DNA-binding SARP family transcriptional activator
MVELAQSWDAPLLEEQLQKEFEEILPKRNELERARMATPGAREPAHDFEKQQPTIQLFSFGSLDVERIVPLGGWERSSTPRENGKDGITGQPGMSDHPSSGRDNKVRQLISLLVLARAESLDSRIGRGAAREGTKKGVSREHLIDLLWPDSDASNANALYSTIKRARAFLGNPEALLLNEEGYFLGPIVQVDCEEAIRHYDEARQARKRNALFSITFHYEQIIKLTDRGPFMSGNYGAWLDGLRTRLATLRRTAAVQLIEIELERGLLERAEEMCFKLLAQDEFDEEALRGLLLINAKRRQTTNVVRLFDNYTKKLKAELRAEPSKELRSLYSSLVPHTD